MTCLGFSLIVIILTLSGNLDQDALVNIELHLGLSKLWPTTILHQSIIQILASSVNGDTLISVLTNRVSICDMFEPGQEDIGVLQGLPTHLGAHPHDDISAVSNPSHTL